jgi:hypothetical protein
VPECVAVSCPWWCLKDSDSVTTEVISEGAWCAVQKRWEREDGKEESWTAGLVVATSSATKVQGTLTSCILVVFEDVEVAIFQEKGKSCERCYMVSVLLDAGLALGRTMVAPELQRPSLDEGLNQESRFSEKLILCNVAELSREDPLLPFWLFEGRKLLSK